MQKRRLADPSRPLAEIPGRLQSLDSLLCHFVFAGKMKRADVIEGEHPRFKEIDEERYVALLKF